MLKIFSEMRIHFSFLVFITEPQTSVRSGQSFVTSKVTKKFVL